MERRRILPIITLLLTLFVGGMTTGCANTMYAQALNLGTYKKSVTYKGTVVEDVDYRTSTELKEAIVAGLSKCSAIQQHIKKVKLYGQIKKEDDNGAYVIAGRAWLYKGVIELSTVNRSVEEIMSTFYHEMAHIGHFYLLSLAQEHEWKVLYAKRMKSIRLNPNGIKGNWWKHPRHRWYPTFPSGYCLYDYAEYLAEHYEVHATRPDWHKANYPEEAKLLKKYNMCPTKKPAEDMIEQMCPTTKESNDNKKSGQ